MSKLVPEFPSGYKNEEEARAAAAVAPLRRPTVRELNEFRISSASELAEWATLAQLVLPSSDSAHAAAYKAVAMMIYKRRLWETMEKK
jgi:hypothetical protein